MTEAIPLPASKIPPAAVAAVMIVALIGLAVVGYTIWKRFRRTRRPRPTDLEERRIQSETTQIPWNQVHRPSADALRRQSQIIQPPRSTRPASPDTLSISSTLDQPSTLSHITEEDDAQFAESRQPARSLERHRDATADSVPPTPGPHANESQDNLLIMKS